jgi:hypothetical protein
MIERYQSSGRFLRKARLSLIMFTAAGMLMAGPALAGRTEAQTALARADAKFEVVTRQVGQSGAQHDQSFTNARERLGEARVALQERRYDRAEMLADQASLMAELAVEKAKLSALQTSHTNMQRALSTGAPRE